MIPAVGATSAAGSAGLEYQWIVVGGSGNLYTSTSTTFATGSWTSRTSSFSSTDIQSVASNTVSLYVAVGNSGKLATSPDGITWTQRTSSFNAGDTITSVAYGDGYWVAVGDNAKVAYSTDGVTWTQKTTGITGGCTRVAWGNGLWVIGNTTGSIYTATDPTGTWTSRTSTLGRITDLLYFKAQSIWLAGSDTGTTGALASSTDGLTWTARTSAISLTSASGQFGANTTVAIAISGLTGTVLDIQSSTDGTAWTNRTPAVTSGFLTSSCASDNNGLIAVSGYQTSTDGINWTSRTVPVSGFGLCHSTGTPSLR